MPFPVRPGEGDPPLWTGELFQPSDAMIRTNNFRLPSRSAAKRRNSIRSISVSLASASRSIPWTHCRRWQKQR